MWSGFKPDDFYAFENEDIRSRIEHIKTDLHPRLKALGEQICKSFCEETAVSLRCQLRSGRWFRTPLWTNVSLIAPEEEIRSDVRRPRLSIHIDNERVIAGFCQSVWRREWKEVCEDKCALIEMIDSTAELAGLQIGLLHWVDAGTREIYTFSSASAALEEATRRGQDFFFVGHVYPWPDKRQVLCSSLFMESAQRAIFSAWPIYEYAFYIALLPSRDQ